MILKRQSQNLPAVAFVLYRMWVFFELIFTFWVVFKRAETLFPPHIPQAYFCNTDSEIIYSLCLHGCPILMETQRPQCRCWAAISSDDSHLVGQFVIEMTLHKE